MHVKENGTGASDQGCQHHSKGEGHEMATMMLRQPHEYGRWQDWMRAHLMKENVWSRVSNPDLTMPREYIPPIALRPGDSRTSTMTLRGRTGSQPDARGSNAGPDRSGGGQDGEGDAETDDATTVERGGGNDDDPPRDAAPPPRQVPGAWMRKHGRKNTSWNRSV